MADWYLLLKSPTSGGYQLWALGDYEANGPVWTDHQTTVGRAMYDIPDDWADDTYPTNTYRCDFFGYRSTNPRDPTSTPNYHPGPPDPAFPFDDPPPG